MRTEENAHQVSQARSSSAGSGSKKKESGTTSVYQSDLAICAQFRLHAPSVVLRQGGAPPIRPELVDLAAICIEGVLLVALVVVAVRGWARARAARQG